MRVGLHGGNPMRVALHEGNPMRVALHEGIPMRVGDANRPALWVARALLVAMLFGLTACITTPLESREWWRVETAHFEIFSSLGETETARLALQAEGFRTAVAFLWGETIAPEPIRTRIYAFDDRGIGRPYSYGSDRSYLLPRLDGDIVVLRTGGGWTTDARIPLKLAIARRLIAHSSSDVPSPWLAEGTAQLASTLEVSGPGASIGILRDDHVRDLRSEQWISFDRLLTASGMPNWSARELALFRAESWALVHYLHLHDNRRRDAQARLARYRALLDEGLDSLEASQSAFGPALQREVWRHVIEDVLPSVTIRIQRSGATPGTTPVTQAGILEELGMLALAIDSDDRAEHYLEEAREAGPISSRALLGFAELTARGGDPAGADAAFRTAVEVAPSDARVRVAWADHLRHLAESDSDAGRRAEHVERARAEYRTAIGIDPGLPSAYAGLAACALIAGEDPAEGSAPLQRARQLLPGDAALRVLGARLALARGDQTTAREHALALIAQAGSTEEHREAQTLLEETESRVTHP